MGTKPDGSLKYTVADTHHTHASYKDGNYDGRYAWVNDKINSRIARIRLDYFVCDKITDAAQRAGLPRHLPRQGRPGRSRRQLHHARVLRRRVRHSPAQHRHRGTHRRYRSMFTCVDAETMEVRWQVLIDGNCDLIATSYDGKLAAPTSTTSRWAPLRGHDVRRARRLPVLQHCSHRRGCQGRQVSRPIGTPKVPVVDGTHEANRTRYRPDWPTSAYRKPPRRERQRPTASTSSAPASSPTATTIELTKVLDWFNGKMENINDAHRRRSESRLGPSAHRI